MYIYVKLALYWNNFGPEKHPLGVLLLWLVLGGVPLPTDDVLQPPGHELHQVSQWLSWANFELGGVPLNACQKKVFKLRAMKFCQNMHKLHTETKKNLQTAVTFRDNDIGFLRFFRHRNFQSSSKLSFFSCQKACKTNNFSLRTTQFCQNQPKGKPHKQEKSNDAATYMKVAMKVSPSAQFMWHALYVP